MKDFNKERFLAYAKYDLNANRSFYRNVSMSILMVTVGLMLFQVLTKWAISTASDSLLYYMETDSGLNLCSISSIILFAFYVWAGAIGMNILAGSWAHGMRKKPGRITMLTLPVSSLEKYLWHTGLMIVGGFVTIVGSIVVADVLNVLLSWMAIGIFDLHFSTLYAMGNFCEYFWNMMNVEIKSDFAYAAVMVLIVAGVSRSVMEMMVFVLSNAVKFNFNVILTFVALSIVEGVMNAMIQGVFFFMGDSIDENFANLLEAGSNVTNIEYFTFMTVVIIAILSAAAGIYYAGYRLFQKAQIYDKWNK